MSALFQVSCRAYHFLLDILEQLKPDFLILLMVSLADTAEVGTGKPAREISQRRPEHQEGRKGWSRPTLRMLYVVI